MPKNLIAPKYLIITFALFSLLFFYELPSFAAPLLQAGKTSIYERVISHPGALLFKTATKEQGQEITPFSVLYVYERSGNMLAVGRGLREPEGWLEADKTTAWSQSLTLLFSPRSGRAPVLFFKTENDLNTLCQAEDMSAQLNRLFSATKNNSTENLPIVASEPDESKGAIASNRFYIMPVLQMKTPFEGVKFLEVASIDPGNSPGNISSSFLSKADNAKNAQKLPEAPKTAIAIVMDTSISMRPYIEQSRNVVREIYDLLEKEKMTDHVSFGVIAFRSNTDKTPGLEYTTRIISDFATAKNRHDLESKLAEVDEAKASSHDFNEDSLAGIREAIEKLSWSDYASRLILLVSDAGPLRDSDNLKSVEMGVSELNDLARQKGIWISVLHIKSPKGANNHRYAEEQYRALSKLSGNSSNYLSIQAATASQGAAVFGAAAKSLAKGMLDVVKNTASGKIMTIPAKPKNVENPQAQAERLAKTLGYAMQLEYLGRKNENRLPSVVNSWIADMDLQKLEQKEQVPTVEVAVLLTKNQLSDLAKQIRNIIDNAERTKKTDAKDFFQGILSASAQMARDPNMPTKGKNLAQLGVLAEFLEGLPYKSDIMLLREDDWYRMNVGQQTAFINRLKSRLARYTEYDRDLDNWQSFNQDNAGDWVYRVPLNMLP